MSTYKSKRAQTKIRLKNLRSLEVLSFVFEHPGSTIYEVSKGLSISYKTAQRYLRELRGKGRLIVKLDRKENVQKFYLNHFPNTIKINEVLYRLEDIIQNMVENEE
jgi:predicted transcriptional regulator